VAASQSTERSAAETWFLTHGLPAVLRPGALVRRVWPRSAPALAAFAVFMAASVAIVLLTGKHTIDIDGTPTRGEWFALGLVVLVLPGAALVGWLVSRLDNRRRHLSAVASVIVILLGGTFGGPTPFILVDFAIEAVVVALILVCTATGVGSIMGWSARATLENLASVGHLFVQSLPVVLLTVLVFFNAAVWTMVSLITRSRLWLALLFLFTIAAVFLLSSTLDRVRPMLLSTEKSPGDDARLTGTPFETLPDRPHRVPLSRLERANVVFVLAVSQLLQVLTVSVVTAGIFFVLGLILLSPEVLNAWTRGGPSDGQIFGMTFPVPQSLIQITLFLGALTFMYLAARAVTDSEYRGRFQDSVIDDLRLTLVARDRYRTATVGQ
jgi:hypothetical protein